MYFTVYIKLILTTTRGHSRILAIYPKRDIREKWPWSEIFRSLLFLRITFVEGSFSDKLIVISIP